MGSFFGLVFFLMMQTYLSASVAAPAQPMLEKAELVVSSTPSQVSPTQVEPVQEVAQELVSTQTLPVVQVTAEEPQPVTAVTKPAIMPQGITTKPEDYRGNWYDKRQILSQARTVYEQVRERIAKVDSQQQGFLTKQRAVDKEMDALFLSLGFEEGELEERYTELMNELNRERSGQGQLTEEERKLLAQVEEKKKLLQEFREEVTTLQELKGAIAKAVSTMVEQIELSRSYEQKAWENYDKIDNVLNEKVAQQLLNEMQSFAEHITAIDSYMRGKLMQYIDQTAESLRGAMQKIKSQVDELKRLGVILSRQIAEQEKAAEEARKHAEELRKQREQADKKTPPPSSGWFATLANYFHATRTFLVKGVKTTISSLSGLITKSSEKTVIAQPKKTTTESIITKT